MFKILGIGELLWDMLPAGPQLGGAPANFTVMAGRLGDHATILSRIGDDDLGRQARDVLEPFPVDCSQLQVDPAHPTGSVTVSLADGQPSYTIHQPVAWDFFEATQPWREAATTADAVCFGSLAQRSPVSRQTILELLEETRQGCQRIFDVNLRAPFYSAEIVRPSLQLATVLKMNDAEVPLLLELLGLPGAASLRHAADCLLNEFASLNLVAITRGGQGSLLVSREDHCDHPGIPTQIADTIGAGDAFTAAMTHYLLRGAPLAMLSEAGNRWGSYVASQSGAMPPISDETLRQIEREIEA
jgi:fructokinase